MQWTDFEWGCGTTRVKNGTQISMLDLRPANVEIGLTAMFNCCDRAFGLGNTGRSRNSCPYYVLWFRFLTVEELISCTMINQKLGDGNAVSLQYYWVGTQHCRLLYIFGIWNFRSQLSSIARSNSTIYYKIKYI